MKTTIDYLIAQVKVINEKFNTEKSNTTELAKQIHDMINESKKSIENRFSKLNMEFVTNQIKKIIQDSKIIFIDIKQEEIVIKAFVLIYALSYVNTSDKETEEKLIQYYKGRNKEVL